MAVIVYCNILQYSKIHIYIYIYAYIHIYIYTHVLLREFNRNPIQGTTRIKYQ